MKKLIALLLALVMVFALAACGNNNAADNGSANNDAPANNEQPADNQEPAEEAGPAIKIGVLVSDTTSGEALGFRAYYENYIEKNYNVDLIYSDELKDAAGETAAIDSMVAQNCKAIISLSSYDRPAQIEQCQKEQVYYAVATGTLTAEQYETYKGYEYYVGAIGPSNDTEFQAGYDMAKHYLDQGMKNFGIFTGAAPYYTEMHIYRVAGMFAAMVEAGGEGASYKGATVKDAIVGQIYADGCAIAPTTIGDINVLSVVEGYTMDDAWFASCASAVNAAGLEAFLAVGNGADFFAAAKPENVKIATVDSYVEALGTAMEAGSVDYLAGKFNSTNGPIFIAALRAAQGNPLRDENGNALALSQGYWVATSHDDFVKYQTSDTVDAPAYTKEILDQYLTADYATFAAFVAASSYEDIAAMK